MKLRGTRRKLKKTSLCPLLNLCTREFALNLSLIFEKRLHNLTRTALSTCMMHTL